MHNYQFIDLKERKFLIKRVIRESHLKPGFDQAILKKWTGSDTLLKKEGFFYCCELVEEAQIIEQPEKQ